MMSGMKRLFSMGVKVRTGHARAGGCCSVEREVKPWEEKMTAVQRENQRVSRETAEGAVKGEGEGVHQA